MKTRIVLEIDSKGEVVSKPQMDSILVEAIKSETGWNAKTIGCYTDEEGNPVSSAFFVEEHSLIETITAMLISVGFSQEKIGEFLNDNEKLTFFYNEWLKLIEDNVQINEKSEEYFKKLLLACVA